MRSHPPAHYMNTLHLDIRLQYEFKDSIFTKEVFDYSQSV
jgi:hypothetical protein